MARLHGDGFDHYGLDETNLLDNVYANVDDTVALVTTQAATGTHSVQFSDRSDNVLGIRKVLSSANSKMGIIVRCYCHQLPTGNQHICLASFNVATDAQQSQVACFVTTNGALAFYRGFKNDQPQTAGTLIYTSDPVVGADAWNHIEIQVNINDTTGWLRAAVNGVHKFTATGLDTQQDASQINSVSHGCTGDNTVAGATFNLDDLAYYDFTGNPAIDTDWCPTTDGAGVATSYIGVLGAYIGTPDADTAEADWLRSAGAAPSYPLIGKTTPDDSTWLYATTATDLSEFGFTDLPPEITYIRGVDIYSRMFNSDAGASMYRAGMKSVAAVYDAPEIPITVEPSYWVAQVNVDPDTGVRWTRASYNAAWLRMTRSA